MNTGKRILIQLSIFKGREYWIAYAPALKLYGYSLDSKEDAVKDFDNAYKTFLLVNSELSAMQKTLLNLKWHEVNSVFTPPKKFDIESGELQETEVQNIEIEIPV